ncbi:hypothetical protein ARSEF1564_005640 [Beauveria bassiana]
MGLPFIKTPKAASPIEEAKQIPIECPFDEEPNPPPEKSAIRFWILSFGICLGLFLSIIDSSIVATALFTIGNDFKDLEAINWIALAYTLAYLGCAVAFAHVSDVIGRRDAFLLASVLFFAFSMASGFAQNIHQLIALRTIQGIGGSGLYSLAMVILPEMCPPSHLKFIGSLIGMVIVFSGVLGPLLGGALTQFTQWRWIFWINGPIGVVSMTIFLLAWPSKSQHNPPSRLQWKNFDFFGTLLIIAASVLIVFAFQRAGETSRNIFSSSIFIAPLTTGLLCWGGVFVWAFLVGSGRFGARLVPALPFKLFRNRHYTSAALTTLLIGYPYLQIMFTFPSRAQIVSGKSVMMSGLELLPLVGGSALGSVIGGMVNGKKNFLFETIATGCCFTLLGCGLLSTVQGRADDAKALGFLVFAGLGFGLSTAAATMLVTFEAAIVDAGFRRTRMDMNEQRAKLFREEEIRRANESPQ